MRPIGSPQGKLSKLQYHIAALISFQFDNCHCNISRGGRFLEAPVSGSKVPAENGQLIFLCGGDEALFKQVEIEQALNAMGKAKFYFGPVGQVQ